MGNRRDVTPASSRQDAVLLKRYSGEQCVIIVTGMSNPVTVPQGRHPKIGTKNGTVVNGGQSKEVLPGSTTTVGSIASWKKVRNLIAFSSESFSSNPIQTSYFSLFLSFEKSSRGKLRGSKPEAPRC